MRFWCLVSFAAWLINSRAQLPTASLNWVFPAGARAGSTNDVTISGTDLDEPAGLLFSDSRISATLKQGTANQFQVIVPSDVPEGFLDVRFVGRFGVSNPRAFAVGKRPELVADGSPNVFDLPLDMIINGRVRPNTVSAFRFAAKSHQNLSIRVDARKLDSRLVPNLTVTDTDGRELSKARHREWLEFTAPSDGNYLLSLSDQTFRGGDDFHFRLMVSTTPHCDFVFPIVLRAGATNRVTMNGNSFEILAPANPSSISEIVEFLRKPAAVTLAEQSFSWNGTLFGLTANPVVTGEPDKLSAVTPPCDFSSLFPQPGKLSGVTFQANKGQVFWLEIFADRFGFSADPHVMVQRERPPNNFEDVLDLADTDGNFGDREFNTVTRDAAARFEAPETGNYRVIVRDLFNLGENRPRYPYWLSIRAEAPDFRLVLVPTHPPRINDDRRIQLLPATLRREQTMAFNVLAFRRDGFKGEIELGAANLPAGLKVAPCRVPEGQNAGTLLMTARDPVTVTNATIFGKAQIGTNVTTRTCIFSSVLWPVADFNNENATPRLNRNAVISVLSAEAAPITIRPSNEKIEVPVDGKLSVLLTIIRRGEFQTAFNLKAAGNGALTKAKDVAVSEKATNVTAEINLAEAKLPPGTHTLWFQGSVPGKYRNNPETVAIAEAELQAAEKALASVTQTEKTKAEERKKAAEAAKKAAEEKAKPRDVSVMVYSEPLIVKVLPGEKK